jgi:hypothetical protein
MEEATLNPTLPRAKPVSLSTSLPLRVIRVDIAMSTPSSALYGTGLYLTLASPDSTT